MRLCDKASNRDRRDHNVDDHGVELRTSAFLKLQKNRLRLEPLPIGSVRRHRINRVRNKDYPGADGNPFTNQPVGIALAIPTLVV